MKTPTLIALALSTLLSGCVAYSEPPHRGGSGDRDRDGVPNNMDRDRDGDGVRNRDDTRPNNPNRY